MLGLGFGGLVFFVCWVGGWCVFFVGFLGVWVLLGGGGWVFLFCCLFWLGGFVLFCVLVLWVEVFCGWC